MPNPNELANIDLDNLEADDQTVDQNKADDKNDDGNNLPPPDDKNDDAGDDQFFVSDEEYLAPYYAQGMPQNIKSLDDAMQWAVSVAKGQNAPSQESQKVQQLNRILAQQGFVGGVDEFLARQGNAYSQNDNYQQRPNSQFEQNRNNQSFLPENPYRATIDADIQNGIIPAEQAATYRSFANVQDRVLKQVTGPLTNTLRQLASVVQSQQATIQETEWRMLPRKIRENVTKYELDAVLNSGRASNYEDAFIYHARMNKPHLLSEYFSGKGNNSVSNNNGNQRRPQSMDRRNFNQRQQSRGGHSGVQNVEKYVLPTGGIDEAALDKLPPAEASKVRHDILRKAHTMR